MYIRGMCVCVQSVFEIDQCFLDLENVEFKDFTKRNRRKVGFPNKFFLYTLLYNFREKCAAPRIKVIFEKKRRLSKNFHALKRDQVDRHMIFFFFSFTKFKLCIVAGTKRKISFLVFNPFYNPFSFHISISFHLIILRSRSSQAYETSCRLSSTNLKSRTKH